MATDLLGEQVSVLARELEGVTTLVSQTALPTHTWCCRVGGCCRTEKLVSPSSPTAQGSSKKWVALGAVSAQLRQEQQTLFLREGWCVLCSLELSSLECVPDAVGAFVAQGVCGQSGCPRTHGRRTGVASSLLGSPVLAEFPLEVLLTLWELYSSILPKSTDVTVTSVVRGWDLGVARYCQEVALAQAGTVP